MALVLMTLVLCELDTATLATAAIYGLDDAIEAVNLERASYGAAINRLEYAADNLANVSQNTSASRSRILDADYALRLQNWLVPKSSSKPAQPCCLRQTSRHSQFLPC